MVREGLGGHQMISQKSFQEGMGCGALTLSTLHKRHKVRNQPRLASRACVGGLKSRKGGGSQNARGTQPKQRKAGLGWARGHPSRVLLGPRTCLPCTRYSPGPGVQALPWVGRGGKPPREACLVLKTWVRPAVSLPRNVSAFRPTASETRGWAQLLGFEQAPGGF